jgi:hypothetical protein
MRRPVRLKWERATALIACCDGDLAPEFCPVETDPAMWEAWHEDWRFHHIDLASMQLDGLSCEDLP